MKLSLAVLALCFAATSYSASRWGVVNVPPENASSDATAMDAIKRTLNQEETSCSIELIKAGTKDQTSPNTVIQVLTVTVTVCGKKQKFSIQRSQTKPDNVLVSAHKL